MPAYIFHLHDGSGAWRREAVAADGLDEARDLAELRLLLGASFVRVEVFEDGELTLNIERG